MDCNPQLIELLISYWRLQDIELMLALCHDDVIYRRNMAPEIAFASEAQGREAVRRLFHSRLQEWEYLEFDPVLLGCADSIGRMHTRYRMLHRASGEILAGSNRTVIHVRDGRVAEIEEFEDVALLAAFIQFARSQVPSVTN